MPIASHDMSHAAGTAASRDDGRAYLRFVGLACASLVPALFWLVLISGIASFVGSPLSVAQKTFVFATIMVFLSFVCAPLMLRR